MKLSALLTVALLLSGYSSAAQHGTLAEQGLDTSPQTVPPAAFFEKTEPTNFEEKTNPWGHSSFEGADSAAPVVSNKGKQRLDFVLQEFSQLSGAAHPTLAVPDGLFKKHSTLPYIDDPNLDPMACSGCAPVPVVQPPKCKKKCPPSPFFDVFGFRDYATADAADITRRVEAGEITTLYGIGWALIENTEVAQAFSLETGIELDGMYSADALGYFAALTNIPGSLDKPIPQPRPGPTPFPGDPFFVPVQDTVLANHSWREIYKAHLDGRLNIEAQWELRD